MATSSTYRQSSVSWSIVNFLILLHQVSPPEIANTPNRMRVLALPHDEMAGILNGLTNLNLESQQVLGDRTNVQNTLRKAKEDVQIDLQKSADSGRTDAIVVSSGSESKDAVPVRFQPPKAVRLGDLSRRALAASDNQTLATLVREFVEALRMNSSRTLTREAFVFLDVLYKQLDNPSVFIQPARFVYFVRCVLNAMPDEKEILGHHGNARLMNRCQKKSLLTLSWEWLRV